MILHSNFKRLLFFFFIGLFFPGIQSARAQENENIMASVKLDSIRNAEPLYYYGVDFSHVRVSDASKISKRLEYRKHYPGAWIGFLDKEIIMNNWVQRALRKESLYYRQNEIIPVSLNMVKDFIIAESWSFPLDTVKSSIKQYNLNEKEGIGLVLFPENFNKEKEQAMMWVIFFDIKSRSVLWATEVTGNCEHMGYTAHWASGIVDGLKKFIRKTYRVPRFPMYDNF